MSSEAPKPRSRPRDVEILRELAKRLAEIAAKDVQNERRRLWRDHNSLVRTRPLIYVRWFACSDEITQPELECEDPFYRGHEKALRDAIFQDSLGDDFIIEPWITQGASYVLPEKGHWGLEVKRERTGQKGGAFRVIPPIRDFDDMKGLVKPRHVIDEEETARNVERLRDAVADTIEVNVDRGPFWRYWPADISTDLAYLRGLEQIMWDMTDDPERLHELLAFMCDGVLAAQEEAEAAGDWSLSDHQNQSMPYARELEDPRANSGAVKRKDLWVFMASQELTLVSPEMHYEFMLQYQMRIMEHFGLSAYGCCEDLTNKIDMVRRIPNLRRIAVTPRADVRRSAEQIGGDYVCSWRPNPAETVCCGFDADRVRELVKEATDAFESNGCHFDVCLKDIETVENEPERLREFVRIVREVTGDG